MHNLVIAEKSNKSEIKIFKQNLIASIKDISLTDEKNLGSINYSPLSKEFFKSFKSEEHNLATVSINTKFHIENFGETDGFNFSKYSNSTKTYFPESN